MGGLVMDGKTSIKAVIEVGVAVRDLDQATRLFVDVLGAEAGPVIDVKRYQMRYRMCRVGGMDFELMESTGEGGVIDKFLKSKSEGLHHIALKVSDLEDVLSDLKGKGINLIDQEPRFLPDHSGRYAFMHPKSFHGVMFELIEEGKS
ncbi:MAG: VOC family protein [Peptococcaceae bacterium]|nr:VOC family protein [Peptococcaceae bacterium]